MSCSSQHDQTIKRVDPARAFWTIGDEFPEYGSAQFEHKAREKAKTGAQKNQ